MARHPAVAARLDAHQSRVQHTEPELHRQLHSGPGGGQRGSLGVQTALSYLEANVDAYVTRFGADGPGQLALLILDAEAGGINPTNSGAPTPWSRLLATEQPGGLFGTDSQLANFAAGNYEQGLASRRSGWLGQRPGAPRHGHRLPGEPAVPRRRLVLHRSGHRHLCRECGRYFTGPDTNSTAAAVQGLAAEGAITPATSAGAVSFYTAGQDAAPAGPSTRALRATHSPPTPTPLPSSSRPSSPSASLDRPDLRPRRGQSSRPCWPSS